MQDEENGRDERTTEAPSAPASDRVVDAPRKAIIRGPRGDTLAWSNTFQRYRGHARELVAFPELHLSHFVTLRLVARKPYHVAMASSTLEIAADGLSMPYHVIRATFPFYRTGQASLTGVLLVLDEGHPLSLPEALKLLAVPQPEG